MRARSSGQPLAPRLCGLPEAPAELRDIPGDAVAGVMACERGGQPFPLVRQRLMAVVRHQSLIAANARASRLLAVRWRTTFLPFFDFIQVFARALPQEWRSSYGPRVCWRRLP